MRFQRGPDRSVDVDRNFIEADPVLVIRSNALCYGKLGCELNRTVLTPANALEDKDRRICFDFVEIAAVPIAQFTLFIEKRDRSPLSIPVYQFGAFDGLSAVKDTLEVRIPESAKDSP